MYMYYPNKCYNFKIKKKNYLIYKIILLPYKVLLVTTITDIFENNVCNLYNIVSFDFKYN